MHSKSHYDAEFTVIGGGIMGICIAWGLRRLGHDVLLVDEGDVAWRASRGNFGLIWVQGKGFGMTDYARWTLQSAALWQEFATELEQSGVDIALQQRGGVDFCLDADEADILTGQMRAIGSALQKDYPQEDYPFEYLANNHLRKLVPELGATVEGGIYCPLDGHVNPLFLLRALYAQYKQLGGRLLINTTISNIEKQDGVFHCVGNKQIRSAKVVLCAGLANGKLAAKLAINAPTKPLRGHILVTERVPPLLEYPSVHLRQLGEGGIQIGDSHENVGLNDQTVNAISASLAHRAVRILPRLAQARMLRSWAALRIMSPDGFPIYQQSTEYPGAFVLTCHSGITLAAVHGLVLPHWLSGGTPPDLLASFNDQRFSL